MLVPVRVFDDHLDLGIHGLGGADDEVPADIVHQREAEIRPAPVALCRDVGVPFRGDEGEVVEDELVEMTRGQLGDVLREGPVLGIGVAKGAPDGVAGLVGVRDPARDPDAVIYEKPLHRLDQSLVGDVPVAMRFDIDLVDLHLAADARPLPIEATGLGEGLHHGHGNVDRDREVPVVPGRRGRRRRPEGVGTAKAGVDEQQRRQRGEAGGQGQATEDVHGIVRWAAESGSEPPNLVNGRRDDKNGIRTNTHVARHAFGLAEDPSTCPGQVACHERRPSGARPESNGLPRASLGRSRMAATSEARRSRMACHERRLGRSRRASHERRLGRSRMAAQAAIVPSPAQRATSAARIRIPSSLRVGARF